MTPVQKAGCILINQETRMVCLIWREKHQDCSFPKGHVEQGESYAQAAVRETDEETGRLADLITGEDVFTFSYIASQGEPVEAHYFLAYDAGDSGHVFSAELVHRPVWVTPDKVAETLTRNNLREFWKRVQPRVEALLK